MKKWYMFKLKSNKKSSGRRRFWPFGQKKQAEDQPHESVPDEQQKIAETSTDAPSENADHSIQQASTEHRSDNLEQQPVTEDERSTEIFQEKEKNSDSTITSSTDPKTEAEDEIIKKPTGLFSRMCSGLLKTRSAFTRGIEGLLFGKKKIDDELLEELETQLITADLGIEATTDIIEHLTEKLKRKELKDSNAVITALKTELLKIVEPCCEPLMIDQRKKPYVILIIGVNGVGKTTTIGKLTKQLQQQNHKVMLAAGDTFRAAAIEQLQTWGKRNEVPVIAQHHGADSASVIFDAYESAKAKNYDVLIADTAGRLHNKDHLMNELKKIKRVLGRLDDTSPHELMLIIDAGTGQNAISQATLFNEAVQLTGITFTKLDGTAKGGIVFALAKKLKLPVRYLGVGEQVDDLQPFSATTFVDALFENSTRHEPTEVNRSV